MKKTKRWLIFCSTKYQETYKIQVRNNIQRLQLYPSVQNICKDAADTNLFTVKEAAPFALDEHIKSLWLFKVSQPDGHGAEPSRPLPPSPRRVSPCSKSAAASPAPSCSPTWWLPPQGQHESLRQKCSISNFSASLFAEISAWLLRLSHLP